MLYVLDKVLITIILDPKLHHLFLTAALEYDRESTGADRVKLTAHGFEHFTHRHVIELLDTQELIKLHFSLSTVIGKASLVPKICLSSSLRSATITLLFTVAGLPAVSLAKRTFWRLNLASTLELTAFSAMFRYWAATSALRAA